jgi:hypothetical protein
MLDAPEGESLPTRRSVSERAAQRDRMQRVGRDRYSSLLHTLHAGRELPLQPRRRGRRLVWHPIAGKLLAAAFIVVLAYLAVTTGLAVWREGRVDTWSGPDASVTSGQKLADCPAAGSVRSDLFPSWIRFDSKVYLLSDTIRPMGFKPDPDFPSTGYSLGSMTLFRILNTPDGQSGRIVAVKVASSAVGRVYNLASGCA